MPDKDIISKALLKRLVIDLAHYLFGLNLTDVEVLDTEYQRVEDRRADLVVRARSGSEFLLHIEIQNDNLAVMPWRMLRYRCDIAVEHPGLPIRQYLIYIGKRPLTMADGIEQEGLNYHYEVIDMQQVDCALLLEQDSPDALILAILCDFKGKPPREVVRHILQRLKALTADDTRAFREYIVMLEVLSTNRDLRDTLKEEEEMLRVELEKLPSYELGWEKGVGDGHRKGLVEGRQEGRQEGRKQEREDIARSLLKVLPIEAVAEHTGLPLTTLRRIAAEK